MRMLSIALLAGLSACGSPAPAPTPKPTPTAPSEFLRKLVELPPATRNIVFIRAIRDAGRDCQGVTGAERRPDLPTGELLYIAKCTDGTSYGVLFQREGTAKIIAREN